MELMKQLQPHLVGQKAAEEIDKAIVCLARQRPTMMASGRFQFQAAETGKMDNWQWALPEGMRNEMGAIGRAILDSAMTYQDGVYPAGAREVRAWAMNAWGFTK